MGTEPPASLGFTGEGWNCPVLFRPLKTWGPGLAFPAHILAHLSGFLETIYTYTENVIVIICETLRLSMVNKNFIWIILTINSKYTIKIAHTAIFHQ